MNQSSATLLLAALLLWSRDDDYPAALQLVLPAVSFHNLLIIIITIIPQFFLRLCFVFQQPGAIFMLSSSLGVNTFWILLRVCVCRGVCRGVGQVVGGGLVALNHLNLVMLIWNENKVQESSNMLVSSLFFCASIEGSCFLKRPLIGCVRAESSRVKLRLPLSLMELQHMDCCVLLQFANKADH